MKIRANAGRWLAGAAFALLPAPAWAGPPFLTDDPQPTELHRWEIYNFVAGEHADGETSFAGGLDLNYGAARDVQLTLVLPAEKEPGLRLHTGDVELAAKFKLLHQGARSPLDLTLFPRVFLPTARGSKRARLLLPVWAQHDAGSWQVFGGGGYMLNPDGQNYWQYGLATNRALGKSVQLGIEYYGQGPEAPGDAPTHIVNLAATVRLGGPFSLLGSFGQGLNRRQTVFYSALKLDL